MQEYVVRAPTAREMMFFEWIRHCRHPQFKVVLELVKRRGS